MLPPAPARFSTTTCCPRFSPIVLATIRATVSVPPPGSKPTTIDTGRLGNGLCEKTPWERTTASNVNRDLMPWVLVGDHAGALHHGPPFLDLVAHELEAVLGSALDQGGAARLERIAYLRVLRRAVERLVEPHHVLARRPRRRGEPEPRRHFITLEPDLVECRHLWQRARALERGDGQRTHLARLDVGHLRRQVVEHQLGLAGEHRRLRRPAAAERDVHDERAGHALEELHRHLRRGAVARRRIV